MKSEKLNTDPQDERAIPEVEDTGMRRHESSNGSERIDPLNKRGEWMPKGGKLFVHSHIFDPFGVRVGEGFEELNSTETVETAELFAEFFEKVGGDVSDPEELRRKYGKEYARIALRAGSTYKPPQ